MQRKHSNIGLITVLLVLIAGCTSPAGTQTALTTQQQINDALKRAPHGSVELSVDYCSPQKEGEHRSQVVELGRGALFNSTPANPYELVVTPFQSPSGDLFVSLRSKWIERKSSTDGPFNSEVVFDKIAIIHAGGANEPLTFRVGAPETCLTLTATRRLTVGAANTAESIPKAASAQ